MVARTVVLFALRGMIGLLTSALVGAANQCVGMRGHAEGLLEPDTVTPLTHKGLSGPGIEQPRIEQRLNQLGDDDIACLYQAFISRVSRSFSTVK